MVRFGHRRIRAPTSGAAAHAPPGVEMLLDVDAEYRDRAARGDCQFTVLFSNTRRAHELGRTDDWVVVYFHTDAEPESQCTIVTERAGPLAGKRVIRGREAECREFYGLDAG